MICFIPKSLLCRNTTAFFSNIRAMLAILVVTPARNASNVQAVCFARNAIPAVNAPIVRDAMSV